MDQYTKVHAKEKSQVFSYNNKNRIEMQMPKNRFRQKCCEIAKSKGLLILDTILSCVAVVLYACNPYKATELQNSMLTILTYLCMIQMNITCIIKLFGFGQSFFQDNWMRYC